MVITLNPKSTSLEVSTFAKITAESSPAFSTIFLIGSVKASDKILTPTTSSFIFNSLASLVSTALARRRVTPPPGTIPSSKAALVAATASITLSFFSFISISVAAPTLITATPPESLANLSCSFSLSKSEVVVSIIFLIWAILALSAAGFPFPPIILVLSLSAQTLSALPQSSIVTESNFLPVSSEITVPPVKIAISSSISFLLSPNPGALTAKVLNVPFNLLTTKTAKASPSISSAIITKFLETLTKFSKNGNNSLSAEIFLSVIKIYGSSISASIFSGLVTKYAEA